MVFFECYSHTFDNLMQQLKHSENNYQHYFADLLLFFYFSTIQKNLYMIRSFTNLLFEGGNTINQYYQKQTRILSLVLLNLFENFVRKESKSFSITSSVSSLSAISTLQLLVYIESLEFFSFFRIFMRNKSYLHC